MAYIGELDERRAWAVDGILSCVHWLSWRLGMGPNAAGERVRVARALRKLPRISEAFGEGRLSYSQVERSAGSPPPTPSTTTSAWPATRPATNSNAWCAESNAHANSATSDWKPKPLAPKVANRSRSRSGCRAGTTRTATCASPSKPAPPTEQFSSPPSRRLAPIFSAERIDEPTQQVSAGEGLLHSCRAYLNHRAATHRRGRERTGRSSPCNSTHGPAGPGCPTVNSCHPDTCS